MRERVALFGGIFEAGPRPEGGFGVRAHLPFDAPRSARRTAGPRRTGAVGVIRVVVVDDEALLRGGLVSLVDSAEDLTVVGEASNGAEALDVVAAATPRRRPHGHPDARDGWSGGHPPPGDRPHDRPTCGC